MCGIGGYYGEGNERVLTDMGATLGQRGPDDRGFSIRGSVGLAHTRLSIIDLSDSGHQPMGSSTGRSSIVFNGEIYNYRELKKEAGDRYVFAGSSDTEVILALYERYGTDAFSRLNGMFAFALYDHVTGDLHLVRDRLGKKPLYWSVVEGTLIFGSELKALMCHPKFKREIDPAAVRMYLTYESIPTPYSIFKNVHKVQAGSCVTYSLSQTISESAYWSVDRSTMDISFEEAVSTLDTKIEKAVERRLVADVPVGVFLSGGIDSSTIAYYAQKASASQIKTFSIGFTDKDFDESRYAQDVARTLGVDHTTEMFSPSRCIELIPEVYSYIDEPLADASALPTYLLSGFTKKHVSVALGGDGADELFAGYPTFQADALLGAYTMIPELLRNRIIEPLIRALPVSHSYFSLEFRMKKFLEGVHAEPMYRHQKWIGAFSESEARDIATPHLMSGRSESPYAHLDQFFRNDSSTRNFSNDVLWSYMRTYCMDQVLTKVDRASMAHGLEVRAPFLDYTVVEFVQSLPYRHKFRGLTGKYILKRLMRGRLPDHIVNRRKKGFAIPVGRWLQHELKPLMHDVLSKERLAESGFFDHTQVASLMRAHEEGVADHRKKLWTLIAFQLWYAAWARP